MQDDLVFKQGYSKPQEVDPTWKVALQVGNFTLCLLNTLMNYARPGDGKAFNEEALAKIGIVLQPDFWAFFIWLPIYILLTLFSVY